jgi:hypothetical protein
MHGASTRAIERERIVEVARSHLGTSYRLSLFSPCQAYSSEDCFCHMSLAFDKFGIRLR